MFSQISAVRSVEALSEMINSKSAKSWARTLRIVASK